MSKLFALEELDTNDTSVELEASPEVGEVADVQVEVEQEVAEAAQDSEAIEEGIGAADQLEQVEDVVAGAVEEGEGLDPVAAESIRIAVEAICARVGANPKAVYSLYARENFASASSRKANTKFALEGIGEFLKDLWKKIKGALTRLMEKAKAFWEKHFSTLGRVKKALESAKAKVSESSGKLKDKAHIEEAPSSLVEAFAGKDDISVAVVKKYIAAHRACTKSADDLGAGISKLNDLAEKAAAAGGEEIKNALEMLAASEEVHFGTEAAPLIGGTFITFKLEADRGEGDLTVEVEREHVESKEAKLGLSVADKAGLQDVIKDTLTVISDAAKAKEKQAKIDAAFSKLMLAIEKSVNKASESTSGEEVKAMRKLVKIIYKANAKAPSLSAELLALNIKLAKSVLGFTAVCLKQYK